MPAIGFSVVHVVGSDISAGRMRTLRALLTSEAVPGDQRVIRVGAGRGAGLGLPLAGTLRAWEPTAWLRSRRFGRVLREIVTKCPGADAVVHAWSPVAAAWCADLSGGDCARVVEIEAGRDVRGIVARFSTPVALGSATLVCSTKLALQRVGQLGVPPSGCEWIPEFVAAEELERSDRESARARLGFGREDTVLTMLPSSSRAGGTFTAVWASLLLGKTRPDVRAVVGGEGREYERARRLVRSLRHEHMVRFVGPGWSEAELLAPGDLAVFLPAGDAPNTSLLWAMAAARPIVASRSPAAADLLPEGDGVWWCRAGCPRDAARAMLAALEHHEESRLRAERARRLALAVGDRAQAVARYIRRYTACRTSRVA